MRSARYWLLCLLFGTACFSCAQEAPAPAPSANFRGPAAPTGQGRVARLSTRAEVELGGPRVEAEAGDFVLRHEDLVAVVSQREGMLIDFGPAGADDELVAIDPGLFAAGRQLAAPVAAISIESEGRVLRVEHRATELPVRLVSFVTFRDRALVIDSFALPEGGHSLGMAVGVGEWLGFGNVPIWVEGVGSVPSDGGDFSTAFIGREGPGLKYALGRMTGKLHVTIRPQGLAGFFASARGSELTEALPDEPTERRQITLTTSQLSLGDAAAQLFDPATLRKVSGPSLSEPRAKIDVVKCIDETEKRHPYATFAASESEIRVPEGCFEARLLAPGHAASAFFPLAELPSAKLPEAGKLSVFVSEDGAPVPARIQVRGADGTPNPSWGLDALNGVSEGAIHSEQGNALVPLPPGKYRVIADRGFEYTADSEQIEVRVGEITHVALRLSRVVDTRGFLAADLHLHAGPSPDAPQSLADRVRSLAASGIEVGVATDHNRVTDYAPAVAELGLGAYVASIVGDEVTTQRTPFGHFNVFPLLPGSAPLRYESTGPTLLFREARTRAPLQQDVLLQVNHPRMGDIGYFDILRLDSEELAPMLEARPGFFAFDAIEIYNGDDATSIANVEEVMRDWYALLDAGQRKTATGNSDSHRLTFHEPGLPRTYVAVADDRPAVFDQTAFVKSLREGRAIVSGGPFIQLEIDGALPGDSVLPGSHEVHITVDAPPWMDVTSAELIVDGKEVARTTDVKSSVRRIAWRLTLDFKSGSWAIASARGWRAMDEVLYRRGVRPFSFTNPVFVGSDGPPPRGREGPASLRQPPVAESIRDRSAADWVEPSEARDADCQPTLRDFLPLFSWRPPMSRRFARHLVALSLLTAAPVATLLVDVSVAEAADASSSPASDDIALTGGQVSALEKKLKDTTDWASDKSKRESAQAALDGVVGGLKRIKNKDPKWDVAAWEKIVSEATARLKKANDTAAAKEAADEANEKAYRDYVNKLGSLREGYDLLAQLDKKPSEVKTFNKSQIVGNMAKAIAKVEALDKACGEKGYAKLTIPSFYAKELPATEACKVAGKWKTLGQLYIELQIKGGVAEEVKRVDGVISSMKKGDEIEANDHTGLMNADKRIEFFRKDYDAAAKLLGAKVEAAGFEPIRKATEGYAAALKEAEKTSRFDAKWKVADASAAAVVAKQHAKGGKLPEGQVLKANAFADWQVKTNVVDKPISRQRDVMVLVKVKDESFCRVYLRNAFQPYKNGWGSTEIGGEVSKFRISGCK